MSKATKRKHVTKELLDNYDLPTGLQQIVKVISGRGNNLHEVETEDGERYLASMPTKFRRNIWMKRGCFVVVEPIEEGNKVKAEIVHILLPDQIKYIKEEGKWPSSFQAGPSPEESAESGDEDELLPNPNRPQVTTFESDEDTTDEEGSDEEGSDEEGSDGDGSDEEGSEEEEAQEGDTKS